MYFHYYNTIPKVGQLHNEKGLLDSKLWELEVQNQMAHLDKFGLWSQPNRNDIMSAGAHVREITTPDGEPEGSSWASLRLS